MISPSLTISPSLIELSLTTLKSGARTGVVLAVIPTVLEEVSGMPSAETVAVFEIVVPSRVISSTITLNEIEKLSPGSSVSLTLEVIVSVLGSLI